MKTKLWIIGSFICLVVALLICIRQIGNLKEQYSIAITNNKAYIQENNGLKDQNQVFQFTIQQLSYYNDSLLVEMNKVREELKIKDREVKSLSYLLSTASKVDSIFVRDTIFKNNVSIDTLIGDNWYQLKLGLKYPNRIIVNPSFVSEKYIIAHYNKEAINPPKKFFLWRLFQRKHKVVEVNILEKNPYIENNKSRFIEIIK